MTRQERKIERAKRREEEMAKRERDGQARRTARRRVASVRIGLTEYENETLRTLVGCSDPKRLTKFAHQVLTEALFALEDSGLLADPANRPWYRFEAREMKSLGEVRRVERMTTAIRVEEVLLDAVAPGRGAAA